MKKQYLFTAAIATLLAAGCQKEQDQELVTLGAVMDQPSKAYIDNRQPCWNEGDEVYVNTAVYPVSAVSGPSAQIADVVGSDSYRAIFPASLVAPRSNISNTPNVPITLPATQRYQVVDGHQRVDAPMGDYSDGGTLRFRNLCSILHVVVNNTSGSDMTLGSLKVKADNAMLSGAGIATVNGTDDDAITLSSDASHAVSLRLSGATNVTLAAGAQSAFDIYLPSFPTDNVTITLTTTNGYYFELTKNNVALRHNTYTTVTLNVDHLTQILAAELVDGPTFNRAIPSNATTVVFEYNSSVSSGVLLSTPESYFPIYGNLDGRVWRVSTSASQMNANPNCGIMFKSSYHSGDYLPALQTIDFGVGFNTSNVTDMNWMFGGCSGLTSLDLSNFNTSNVTDISGMFSGCSGLTSLDVSNFNTSNVTKMNGMFHQCRSLTSLDVSNFNTTNVTNMSHMFAYCLCLTSLDLSNFNTSNVTDMSYMFNFCRSLTSLDVSNFNTSNVTNMFGMFATCMSLTSLDVSNFNTENVTSMVGMFSNCRGVHSLDLSNFNTRNVSNMAIMFAVCYGLTSLNLSNFNTESVTDMTQMFQDCTNLTSLNVSSFNTSNVTDMHNMFAGCTRLRSLDISNFNTSNVTNMEGVFCGCLGLTSLDLSNFNTSNVRNMNSMFVGCSSMTSLDLSNFNTSNVTDISGMFSGCSGLTSLDVSNFNTSNVTDMRRMFQGCSSLTSLDLSSFYTTSVFSMHWMFQDCTNLTSLDLSNFVISNTSYRPQLGMCYRLSATSGHCNITCPLSVEQSIKEINPDYDGTPQQSLYYFSGLPTSGVTFTWVRPTSK